MREDTLKKKIIRLALFLCTFLVVLVILSAIFDALRSQNPEYVSEVDTGLWLSLNEPSDTVDIMIVGDSETLSMIQPRQFYADTGSTAYIAGGAGQAVAECYYTLKYLYRDQSPKLIILESNLLTEPFRKSEYYTSIRNITEYYLPIFRTHNVWGYLAGNSIPWRKSDKGWISRNNIIPGVNSDYMSPDLHPEVYEIPAIRKYYISQIKKLCEENGSELLVVTMPSARNFNYSKLTALQQEFEQQDIAYLDLNTRNDEIGIDWTVDTADEGDHINDTGMLKVMPYLEQYLAENYDLPDHRGDSAYDSWYPVEE